MLLFLRKKNILTSILWGACFILSCAVNAQENGQVDSLPLISDSKTIVIDTASREYNKNPRIAILSSAVMPGLGQIYNEKYWKVPIVWGGALGLYTLFDYNNTLYHRYKLALEQTNENIEVTDPDLNGLDANSLEIRKNGYRRDRDYAIIFMGLLYVANIIDAMVDAYMLDYDISEDLTLHWEPALIPSAPDNYSNSSLGLNIQLRF